MVVGKKRDERETEVSDTDSISRLPKRKRRNAICWNSESQEAADLRECVVTAMLNECVVDTGSSIVAETNESSLPNAIRTDTDSKSIGQEQTSNEGNFDSEANIAHLLSEDKTNILIEADKISDCSNDDLSA